jgi:caffeoyl-CoA O-methyltransferase
MDAALMRRYAAELFAPEDEALRWIQAEADRQELPHISLQPDEGRLLQMLIMLSGARKALEIGTLAGYSGTWIARALPAEGKLITLEKSSKHAAVARASFEKAGVGSKVQIMEGSALDLLHKVEPQAPFDFIFMDADPESYVTYLEWATRNLRRGGVLAAHNAFAAGNITNPIDARSTGMANFHQALKRNSAFETLINSVGDGMTIAYKIG